MCKKIMKIFHKRKIKVQEEKEMERLEGYEAEVEYCSGCRTVLGQLITNPMDVTVFLNDEIKRRNIDNAGIEFIPSESLDIKCILTGCGEDKYFEPYIKTKITGKCKTCGEEHVIFYDHRHFTGF
jgi:hypothetical protein